MSEEVKYQAFDGDVDDEESLLRQTRQARIRVANLIMEDENVHKDKDLVNSLEKMLSGVDRQILGKRRAEAAQKTAGAAQDVANALNSVVLGRPGVRIQRHDDNNEENTGYQPALPNVPKQEHKEGELAPVGEKIDVNAIMAVAFARPGGSADEE
ncbi:hypothetical protein pEaSNUABM10_00237 [Erwinia phage pEa_SNUABM_10]|nr:hypothetical protein pEaSNUABM10_00237 [Erwinia phage pEa_SNUABM_10]